MSNSTNTYVALVGDDESLCRSLNRLLRVAGIQSVSYLSALLLTSSIHKLVQLVGLKARPYAVTMRVLVSSLVLAFLLTLCSCSSTPPPAVGSAVLSHTKGRPGSMLVQTVKVTVTVAGINAAKHQATLLAGDGTRYDVRVARGAAFLDQLRAGDKVAATLTEKVRLALKDDAAVLPSDNPANAPWTQSNARVIEINQERRTVSLQFDNGDISCLPVREDYDLTRHRIGDQVIFCTVDIVADWIEKVP